MSFEPSRLQSVAALLALTLVAPAVVAETAAEEDPWRLVDRVRAALEEASPLAAGFSQLYLPAGFAEGETELGRLALDLPACVKWEYDDPFPRAYLLCDDLVWTWNEGEDSGRRQRVAEEDQPGLDLLRLRVEALRRRYRAELDPAADGGTRIRLTPLAAGELRDAVLTLDRDRLRVTALAYHDAEGNLTRFEFGDYAPVDGGSEPFTPPRLDWLER